MNRIHEKAMFKSTILRFVFGCTLLIRIAITIGGNLVLSLVLSFSSCKNAGCKWIIIENLFFGAIICQIKTPMLRHYCLPQGFKNLAQSSSYLP